MKKSILILGGTSDIGMATAHYFASKGYDIKLAARDSKKLESNIADFKIRYDSKVTIYEFDVLKTNTHENFVESFLEFPDVVICAVGYMGEQEINENNYKERALVIRSNYEGPVNILSEFANYYEKKAFGIIVGISSVAGERGRAINYIYGSSKSAFTTFLSGLRNRLANKNVHVVSVLPGPVKTKMTEGIKLPKLLTSNPKTVAEAVYNAVDKRKNIIYVGKIWIFIMFIIKIIPERIFKLKKL